MMFQTQITSSISAISGTAGLRVPKMDGAVNSVWHQ